MSKRAHARIHSNEDTSDDEDVPTAKKQKVVQEFDWKKYVSDSPKPNLNKWMDFSPKQLFELFFDEEAFDDIVIQTNLYALQNNIPYINITKEEVKIFFSILMIYGYSYLNYILLLLFHYAACSHHSIYCSSFSNM